MAVIQMKGKVKGRVIGDVDGLRITCRLLPAKRHGRDRIWIQIRQNGTKKKWRVSTCLAYARSLDVQFMDMPEPSDE